MIAADPKTTAEEKARAEAQTAALNTQTAQAAIAKATATAVQNIAVTAASYIPNFTPTAQFQTAAQALNAIQKATDPVAAQTIASQTGLIPLRAATGDAPVKPSSSTATTANTSKGTMSNTEWVNIALTRAGMSYQDAVAKVPAGKMGVIDNASGQFGYIDPTEYNTKQYTQI